MDLSRYNILYDSGDEVLVFNSLTGAFVKFAKSDWESLEANLNDFDESDLSELAKLGIIVESRESELMLYKNMYYRAMYDSRKPLLYIAPTMKCNFNCPYCFEGNHKTEGAMSDETVENLVRFLRAQKMRDVSIIWIGGEPMLSFDTILKLSEKFKESGIVYSSSMITNGSIFPTDTILKLPELNLGMIQISMDGIAKDQNKRRCFKNGTPSFDVVVNNIGNLLAYSSIPVVVQVTVDKENIDAERELYSYFKSKFPEYIESQRLRVQKNYVQDKTGFDSRGTCYTPNDVFKREIEELKSIRSFNLPLPGKALPCGYRSPLSFAIDSAGNIYKCLEHLGHTEMRVGSLNEGKLDVQKIAGCSLSYHPFDDRECIECNVLPLCGGGCPLERAKVFKGGSNNYCSHYKNRLHEMLPVIYERQMAASNQQ